MNKKLFTSGPAATVQLLKLLPKVLGAFVERIGRSMLIPFQEHQGLSSALPESNAPSEFGARDRCQFGPDLLARTVTTGEAVLVSDLSETAFHVPHRDSLLKMGLRSCLAMPLKVNGRPVGAAVLHADTADTLQQLTAASLHPDGGSFDSRQLDGPSPHSGSVPEDELLAIADRSVYLQRVDALIGTTDVDTACLGLLVFDIAGLAVINDALSHQVGDNVLRLVAARLQARFGDGDLLCHLGGGTFALAHSCRRGDEGAYRRCRERVDELFESPFEVAAQELRLTTKSGFAQFPEDGADGKELLHHAETALGHAKQAGKRSLRHRPTMNAAASQQLSIANRLRAIAGRSGFLLNYQPKVAVSDGSVIGLEALLRWPDYSIPPNVFIPILESIGLIDRVGRWVIDRSLTECAGLFANKTTGDFRVAVNVSPLQLRRLSFADEVLELVDRGPEGFAKHLELEVTESMLMADPARARASLSRLRKAGITVAIDDFGTGHSSLRVLTHLPLDVLKIDRCFVRHIANNRRSRLIVQTAITLAGSLGMKTVAEGVETVEQADVLKDLGCDVLQGYVFMRPAPLAEVGKWLAGRKAAAQPDEKVLTVPSASYRQNFRALPTVQPQVGR